MRPTGTLVVFSLGGRRFGIAAADVQQVFPAAEATPLPDAPQCILGLLDLHGEVLPVIDLRIRCGIESRETQVSDRFVLTTTGDRRLLLRVDSIDEVIDSDSLTLVEPDDIVAGLSALVGVLERPEGLIIVPDYLRLLAEELRRCG